MTRRLAHLPIAAAMLVLAGAAAPAAAQSLAERVGAIRDGTVVMRFAARPGVCGSGRSIRIDDTTIRWSGDDDGPCDDGPVRVALTVRDRRIVRVRTRVGGEWRPAADAVDLGAVPAPAAAAYLLDLAATLAGEPAKDAILPATLADSATVWPALLDLSRDGTRPRATRKAAVFWLGQQAAHAATAGLEEIVEDPNDDREVRKAAVFALSQRPADEGVPALIRIARTSPDPELRRSAIFWLGQSEDPRALDFFEEVLLSKGGTRG
ncbi:MAG TPA: HEAT repeat domain-containing protein [Longimicrobiales bacterium]